MHTEPRSSEHLHKQILVIDGHVDLPKVNGRIADLLTDGEGQFDIPKALAGGVNAAVVTVGAGIAGRNDHGSTGRLEHESAFQSISLALNSAPNRIALGRTPDELRENARDGIFTIILGFQNAAPLTNLSELDHWVDRGVIIVGLCFIGHNTWAASSRPYPFVADPPNFDGLSVLGVQAVRLLNDRGVIVDVSQLSEAAVDATLIATRAPVLASHTGLRAHVDAERSLSDRQIRAIAAGGGLVNIVGFSPYLEPLEQSVVSRLSALWQKFGLAIPDLQTGFLSVDDPDSAEWSDNQFWEFLHCYHDILELDKPSASTQSFVDSIDHAVQLIGIDHVGLSSDFNHGGGLLDWPDASQSRHVTEALVGRGYSDLDISKLWGQNFLALWNSVQSLKVENRQRNGMRR
ncbi:hypothetical protein BS297_27325 [Rhodococcus erythropolis]|uniref:Membrane dipeptidase n=1 Tax=Rhodococcus erythropolis TaxID=1833 RepID=A0A5N5DVK4_RHOER|nr:hypothetical protein BS297_27325 [Rhodococcus erythropolis]